MPSRAEASGLRLRKFTYLLENPTTLRQSSARSMTSSYALIEQAFQRGEALIRERSWFTEEWICKNDFWTGPAGLPCRVLKLLKRRWSNDDPQVIGNETGVFFSVWLESPEATQLHFNIHALKLRQLRGYALESRKFADAFRAAFEPLRRSWPEHSIDFGPQTLMQGVITWDMQDGEREILGLADNFAQASELIDELLSAREVKK